MRKLILLLITISLYSCSNPFAYFMNSSPVVYDKDTITYDGMIVEKSVSQIIKFFDEGKRNIVMSSSGGEIEAAYKLAIAIQKYNVRVVISGPCISACSIAFSGAKEKIVKKGGYLGFHWNARSNSDQLVSIGNELNGISRIENFLRDESNFNSSIGVSQDLYEDAWILVKYKIDHGGSIKNSIWLPTIKELKCYGYLVNEYDFPYKISSLPFSSRLTIDLFTTKDLIEVPNRVSKCVGI